MATLVVQPAQPSYSALATRCVRYEERIAYLEHALHIEREAHMLTRARRDFIEEQRKRLVYAGPRGPR